MSWVATAIIASAVIGVGTAAYSSDQSRKQAHAQEDKLVEQEKKRKKEADKLEKDTTADLIKQAALMRRKRALAGGGRESTMLTGNLGSLNVTGKTLLGQ